MIYLFVVVFSFFLVLLDSINRKSKTICIANFYCLFLLFLLLVCVTGFRYRVGIDTLNYMENYSQVPSLADFSWEYFFEGDYEFLYVLLVNISRVFSDSFFSFQFLQVAIVNTVIFRFAIKYSANVYIYIFLYIMMGYLYFNTEILRESIAICCFILSWEYLQNGDYKKYYAWVVIALLGHYSASFCLFLPCIKKMKLRINFLFVLLGVLLISILGVGLLVNNIDLLASILPKNLLGKIYAYFVNDYNRLGPMGILFGLIFNVCTPLMLIYLSNKKNVVRNKEIEAFICLYVIVSILGIFFIIFSRFNNYLLPIYILYLCNFISERRERFKKQSIFNMVFTGWILLAFIYPYLKSTEDVASGTHFYNRWVPYHSVFDPLQVPERERLWRNWDF
ncbi:EpsG family protein [Bacteroides sp. CACC 737]|uniref:EpsG family protein n=1 Tax=Bacteroides TaxID=816 RepID=UPI00210556F3|nr:EpsG family protein [Bacteroides sp. CACC 737]